MAKKIFIELSILSIVAIVIFLVIIYSSKESKLMKRVTAITVVIVVIVFQISGVMLDISDIAYDQYYYYKGHIVGKVDRESLKGSIVNSYDFKSKELKLSLSSGDLKSFKVQSLPSTISNEKSLPFDVKSEFYKYLLGNRLHGDYTVKDWDDDSKVLVYECGTSHCIKKLKLGVDGFYEEEGGT